MMEQTLKQAIERLQKTKAITSIGIVKEVKNGVCSVEREHLPPLLEVRLNAVQAMVEHPFWIIPKIGSKVLCLEIENNPAETCIVKYTDIERIEMSIGGAIFKIENGIFSLKNNNADLKILLNELLTELKNAIIQTPSGVGNFSPNNKMKFEQINEKINQLFG